MQRTDQYTTRVRHPAGGEQQHPSGPSDYDLIRLLGKGTFGAVYMSRKCNGEDMNSLYAMKGSMIRGENGAMNLYYSRLEYSAMMVVDSPFVLKAVDGFRTFNISYLVTELALSGDLRNLMNGWVKFNEDQARFYLAEIATGISHIHEAGIIHKDIKPENVLLDAKGHCKIADMGLCSMGPECSSTRGTTGYKSPEVVRGEKHSYTVDWWAFGVIAYEMMIGRPLFTVSTKGLGLEGIIQMIKTSIQFTDYPMPIKLSQEAQNLLGFCIERDPHLRPGAKQNGLKDLVRLPFFRCLDWSRVLNRQLQPPFHRKYGTTENDWVKYVPPILLSMVQEQLKAKLAAMVRK